MHEPSEYQLRKEKVQGFASRAPRLAEDVHQCVFCGHPILFATKLYKQGEQYAHYSCVQRALGNY